MNRWVTIRSCASRAAYCGGRQQTLNLTHDTIHFILIRKRNHEKLIAFVETDDAVGKQPDRAEKRIPAYQPTHRRTNHASWL